MSVTFHYVHPDAFDFLPLEIIKHLERAATRSESLLTPKILIHRARCGIGEVYIVKNSSEVMGILYLIIQYTDLGKILNIPMLGGKKLKEWKEDLRGFIRKIMMDNQVEQLIIITNRMAWSKFFPELKQTDAIYSAKVLH